MAKNSFMNKIYNAGPLITFVLSYVLVRLIQI